MDTKRAIKFERLKELELELDDIRTDLLVSESEYKEDGTYFKRLDEVNALKDNIKEFKKKNNIPYYVTMLSYDSETEQASAVKRIEPINYDNHVITSKLFKKLNFDIKSAIDYKLMVDVLSENYIKMIITKLGISVNDVVEFNGKQGWIYQFHIINDKLLLNSKSGVYAKLRQITDEGKRINRELRSVVENGKSCGVPVENIINGIVDLSEITKSSKRQKKVIKSNKQPENKPSKQEPEKNGQLK